MSKYALKGKRPYGAEQPYTGGKLKFRIPFIHYPFEFPDAVQGAILCVVPMGITAAMTEVLGIPFEIAIAMVILNNFMYLLHTHFGDPAVAGWITPGIPLYIAFLTTFEPGLARIHALIALQLTVGLIFLVLGVTGLAKKVVDAVPMSVKAGILLGAAFASLMGEFRAGGRVFQFPIALILGLFVSFFMLFSNSTAELRKRYSIFRFIAAYGIAIPFLLSYVVGIIVGEVGVPSIQWSFTPMPLGQMVSTLSPFSIGFPSFSVFVAALPLAFAAYIIAFGDTLVAAGLLKAADEKRQDEKVIWEPNRNHIITAVRNLSEGFLFPYLPLAGPQWAGGQALVANRYMNSTEKEEETYWGGATSIFWGMSIALLLGPLVTFFRPGLAIGLSLTLLLQGYLCGYLAMSMVKDNLQRGIAMVMGVMIATQGAAWGLGIGLGLYLALERNWFKDVPEEAEVKAQA
ncbi:MAG: hypothetical protein KGZ79_04210 [Dethiobacter sp.]|jgi:hypothetical protein|nr:hypothetical protein [Dethiobacter sp.]